MAYRPREEEENDVEDGEDVELCYGDEEDVAGDEPTFVISVDQILKDRDDEARKEKT